MTEKDPGVQGTKLSKSGGEDDKLIARNKSYLKVLEAQHNWIQAVKSGAENDEELRDRWLNKSAWHEKEHGW